MQRVMVAMALAAGCTGPEHNFQQLHPILAVSPQALDFGPIGPPQSSDPQVVTLSNEGKAELHVTGELTGSPTFALAGTDTLAPGPFDLRIAAGDHVELPIVFTPITTFDDYAGKLEIASDNDDQHPTWTVPLTGSGVYLPYPDIEIRPGRTLTIDEVPPGETAQASFDIYNVGQANLLLGTTSLQPDHDSGEFTTLIDVSGQMLIPGDHTTMVMSYDPVSSDGTNAILHIPSNDLDETDTTVLLLGNGGGDWPLPIADIACPGEVLLAGPEVVHLDGSGSTDPAGFDPLAYNWTVLVRPPGADLSVPLDPSTEPVADLYVDVAGTWLVQLQVTNQLGTLSAPALCVLDAKPEDALHVELSWDTPTSDLDLHVVEGGYAFFDSPEDCYYCNKNPSWGVGADEDDPRLDIDDQGGYGPENINILAPVEGTYDVAVHYYAKHSDGASIASVKVWLDGVDIYDDSKVLQQGDLWTLGEINWDNTTGHSWSVIDTMGTVGQVGCGH